MTEIVGKERLAPQIVRLEVRAPPIARRCQPGQFVIIRIHERGERVPLTIADWDAGGGTITLVFLEVGKTTRELGTLGVGDHILNVVGPLGNPSQIKKFGRVVCVGGGVGIAAIYPIARALRRENQITSIIGARTAGLLIYEKEIAIVSDELLIATDDGSRGHRGFVTDVLHRLLQGGKPVARVVAVGPAAMMKAVAEVTRPWRVKTIVSLNSLMVDGTGMCGACRVEVGGQTRFTCVDGPEFDAHQVNFDLLIKRLDMYKKKEELAVKRFERERSEKT